MATFAGTNSNDFIAPTANGVDYRGGQGDDTYLISALIPADAVIAITDTEGANKIQLADGLTIASSLFYANAVQLTLSNGAKIQITGASNFVYDLGANASADDIATTPNQTYTNFATVLGATVPAANASAVAGATNAVVNSDGSVTGGGVVVPPVTPITYTLSGADSINEGGANTFTVTASEAVTVDTEVTFQLALGTAQLNDFGAGSFNAVKVVIKAGETTATHAVTAIGDDGTELSETYSVTATVGGVAVGTTDVTILDGSVGAGQTFTLTAGVDTVVGTAGNDTIVAADTATGTATWSAVDAIDGGAGNDTLTIAQAAVITGVPAGASIKNVETVKLVGSLAVTANMSAFTDIQTLNVISGAASVITAAATTDVNELSSINTSSITGGKNVTVVHGTAGDTTVADAAGAVNVTSNLAGGSVTVTQVNKATGDITVAAKGNITAGGTSLNASIVSAVTKADQLAHVAASTAATAAETAANAAETAAAAVVTALGVMNTAVAAGTANPATVFAATLVALNAKAITLAQKVAIDSSFATGLASSAVPATALAAAKAAALALETPILTAATAAEVATAATLATATAAKVAPAALVTADTGAAAYTVTDIANVALTSATVSGNYTATGALSVRITDASTLSNTLTTVMLDNAGAATLTGKALTNVSVSNGVNAVVINNATVGHTENLTLTNTTAGTITDAAATTVNVISNGTANAVTLAATAATALNISGAGNFTDAGLATGLAAAAVITATGSTGNNTVTIAAGQTYTGGNGVNTITTGAAAQTKAVTAGTGIADKLVITNAANSATAPSALFTGFEVLQTTGAAVDASLFTKSAFTSVVTSGSASITGLNATQAAHVTVMNTGVTALGVTGASTVGQLDVVSIDANDGVAAMSTIALGALTLTGVETINLTATDNVTLALGGALAFTNVNVLGGAGTVGITTGAIALNVNSVIDAHLATGAVTVTAAGSTANGLKIVGSDTAASDLTLGTLAGVIIAGNGNNTLNGSVQADTITSGNGNSTITGNGGADIITVGNGYNTITGGAAVDTITVGTGGNIITSGAGADIITLGAHVAGVRDTLIYGASAAAGANVGGAANMDTITGFVSGADTIQLQSGDATVVTGAYLAGSLLGLNLVAGTSSAATMLAAVTDATSVADLAAVFTALGTATGLDNSAGHAFAASTALAGGIVAREVVYTTGAAAGTYLVINDSTDGFGAGDIVIKLVGNTAFAAADLTVV